jgi:predicted transcriptional regulator
MEPTLLDGIVFRLQEFKGRWPEVAEGSGVPVSTVRKVAQGRTKNPGVDTVEKLWKYLEQAPRQ